MRVEDENGDQERDDERNASGDEDPTVASPRDDDETRPLFWRREDD